MAAAAALDPSAVTRLLDEHFATGSFEQVVDGWLLPELERLGQGVGRGWRHCRRRTPGGRCGTTTIERRLRRGRDSTVGAPLCC